MTTLASVTDERRGGTVIARVRGEIDASNAAWLGARLRSLLTNHSDALAIDLSETSYLDSAGIALVFALAEELATHQQQLHLVVPAGAAVARMLQVTGVERAARVHTTLDAI